MTKHILEPGEIVFTLPTLGADPPLLLASPALVTCNVPGAAGDARGSGDGGRSSRRRLDAALAATE